MCKKNTYKLHINCLAAHFFVKFGLVRQEINHFTTLFESTTYLMKIATQLRTKDQVQFGTHNVSKNIK